MSNGSAAPGLSSARSPRPHIARLPDGERVKRSSEAHGYERILVMLARVWLARSVIVESGGCAADCGAELDRTGG